MLRKRMLAVLLALTMVISCTFPTLAQELPEEEAVEAVQSETLTEDQPQWEETTELPEQQPEESEELPEEKELPEEIPQELPGETEETAEEQEPLPEEEGLETEAVKPTEEPSEEELAQEEPVPEEIVIYLGDSPSTNFKLLQNAIKEGSASGRPIRIGEPGVYTLFKSAGSNAAIHLLPGTVLDLGGATLVRGGIISNLMFLCDENDMRTGTGYEMSGNITVKNGGLDGSGGAVKDCNLINVGHANNVVFSGVDFSNCRGAHLIEFTGCRDCLVENCTFTGYIPASNTNEPGEAIQLDISYGDADSSWNGIYVPDGTPCENITITGCVFRDYPSGVGNHHTVQGAHNSGIVITNNRFENTLSFKNKNGADAAEPAIACYAFDDSVISGNTITGLYSSGIEVSGGSVTIENNQIGTAEAYFAAPAMVASYDYAWIPGNPNRCARIKEYVSAGSITGNSIYCSSASSAVTLYNYTNLTEISQNTIVTSGGHGIYISKSTVSEVNSNKITAKGGTAIYMTGGTVTNIKKNTLKSCKTYGVYLTSSSKVTGSLSSNTISTCKKSGIYAACSCTVSKVQSNKISGCKAYGICILNTKIKVTVTKNTFSNNKENLNIKAKGTIQEA